MSALSKLSGDDHPVSFAAGAVAAAIGFLALGLAWYFALILGMVVSGLLEFGIREVPPDTDDYDAEQYELWDAMTDDDPNHGGDGESDEVARLRERYARGEIDEQQFERELEAALDAEMPDATAEPSEQREPLREREG
ncbi:hypothetical protein GJ629_02315 [Halapricum sp. CBA1109]|uniref:SHOCT domain-containing protein n=1 Tax=Halapricum sp. CBA1109 TaxID=2668068 RepID=UPI0012FA5CAB|nr:SHOCT domain-containing protein [Halapricum sp. CBA1109]MUV88873.1 hypothetical protein [Halapricum sp. CBA1109]